MKVVLLINNDYFLVLLNMGFSVIMQLLQMFDSCE